MANKDFKTIYNADFSSQGALINEVFPDEVRAILTSIKCMESNDSNAILAAFSWLSANLPPFRKFMKDYDELQKTLQECRQLKEDWQTREIQTQKKLLPHELRKKIYYLYERWWVAYNESGAGIRGTIYIPRDKQIKDAFQRI